jgi:hypothetical protein
MVVVRILCVLIQVKSIAAKFVVLGNLPFGEQVFLS